MSEGRLPDYIAKASPNPPANRTAWYKSTAPTYAGIMLWFVFWQDVPTGGTALPGGTLAAGLGTALLALVAAALVCHFLFYLVPGLFGMKTGLPLYVIGSSTYGAKGGFIMPGFLMGVLQFGWLGVNTYFSALAVSALFGGNVVAQKIIMVLWAVVAAFVGLKGIQYVAKVATFLPAIPFVILIIMFVATVGNIGDFDAQKLVQAAQASNPGGTAVPLEAFGVFALMLTYIVGFFATAGAAGADFGMNNPDAKHVNLGGLTGIAGATVIAGGLSLLVAAGAFAKTGSPALQTASSGFMAAVISDGWAKWMAILLAIAAFPSACFSALIAANSFKTTLPHVNPFVSVGIGAAVSIVLAVTGWAGDVIIVFKIIGASFGPICGAMLVEYFLSGKQWSGPRAGFNPAGWISWAGGFALGLLDIFGVIAVPAAPVVAFLVGALLYGVLAKAGLQSAVIPMPAAAPKA